MNYELLYNSIIEKAKSSDRVIGNGVYYEKHHIKPRSLFKELENDVSNIVLLTPKEHFICHMLLERIYDTRQMKFAIWRMCNDGKYKVSSRYYDYVKKKIAMESSRLNKGKKLTEESKKKISLALTGHKHSSETKLKMKASYDKSKHIFSDEVKEKLSENAKLRFTGKKQTEAFKKHLSEIRSGSGNTMYGKSNRDFMTEEKYAKYRKKLSDALTGHKCSDETKKKIGDKTRLRTQGSDNPNAKKVIIVELEKEFGTISECCKFLEVNRNLIARNRNGNISKIKGYTIKFE